LFKDNSKKYDVEYRVNHLKESCKTEILQFTPFQNTLKPSISSILAQFAPSGAHRNNGSTPSPPAALFHQNLIKCVIDSPFK
jgi:hypothetical protein